MVKVPKITSKVFKNLKRGQIKLCHAPNGSLCWASKNQVSEVRWFNFGNNNGNPPKIVEKFSKSYSYDY